MSCPFKHGRSGLLCVGFHNYGCRKMRPTIRKGETMSKSPAVVVKQPEPPAEQIPTEVLATAIVEISAAMKKIDAGRLKREAIVLLIHANSGVGKPDIRLVLNNLEALELIWLKPKSSAPAPAKAGRRA